MKGFIYRRGGIALTAIMLFNILGGTSYALEDDSELSPVIEEELINDAENGIVYDEVDLIEEEIISDENTPEEEPEDSYEPEYYEEDLKDEAYSENNDDVSEPVNNDTFTENDAAAPEDDAEYFTVTYATDDYSVAGLPVDNRTYKKGDTVVITAHEPTRRGYLFWGWSETGDASCVYSAGYTFTITDNVTFYATWTEDESFYEENGATYAVNNVNNKDVAAINKYVNSLNGRFNPYYYYGKTLKSIQCCALTDQIWQNVFGISRYSNNKQFQIIDSKKKLGKSEITKFLKDNNAKPGDIIWCHDPVSAKKYNITHFMMLMGYDNNGLIVTDGYERNGKGIIWKNNQRVSFTGDHAKYFSGKCYIRIYHRTNN